MGLGDTETASKTASAVVGMEPGNWHIPLQGASKARPWPSPGPELRQSRGKLEPDRTIVEVVTGEVVTFPAPQVCQGGGVLDSGPPQCAALVGATLPRPDAAADEDKLFDGASGQANDAKAAAGLAQQDAAFLALGVQSLCGREPLPPVEGTQELAGR